jgi:hypothetical protein
MSGLLLSLAREYSSNFSADYLNFFEKRFHNFAKALFPFEELVAVLSSKIAGGELNRLIRFKSSLGFPT